MIVDIIIIIIIPRSTLLLLIIRSSSSIRIIICIVLFRLLLCFLPRRVILLYDIGSAGDDSDKIFFNDDSYSDSYPTNSADTSTCTDDIGRK